MIWYIHPSYASIKCLQIQRTRSAAPEHSSRAAVAVADAIDEVPPPVLLLLLLLLPPLSASAPAAPGCRRRNRVRMLAACLSLSRATVQARTRHCCVRSSYPYPNKSIRYGGWACRLEEGRRCHARFCPVVMVVGMDGCV